MLAPALSTASISLSVQAILLNRLGSSLRSKNSPPDAFTLPKLAPLRPPMAPYVWLLLGAGRGAPSEEGDEGACCCVLSGPCCCARERYSANDSAKESGREGFSEAGWT